MYFTDDCGFGDMFVQYQRAFDFSCSHAVAGYIQHIIDATGYPVVAILVATYTVAGEIHAGIG